MPAPGVEPRPSRIRGGVRNHSATQTDLKEWWDRIQNNGTGVTIQGERINNLRFVDDIDLIEDSWEALQESVRLYTVGDKAGIYKDVSLNINIANEEAVNLQDKHTNQIVISDEEIENVAEFFYFG